jgi:serine/threonine protein kinase
MLDWNDSDDSDASDNTDNDDDDRPSDDDSDSSRPSYPPPSSDPRGGSNPKYYGGSGGGGGYNDGGNSSGGSDGGFFQFQLSQLSGSETGRQYYWADQHIKPTGDKQHIPQRTRCTSEPLHQRSIEDHNSAGTRSTHDKSNAAKGDYTSALARDVISGALAQQDKEDHALCEGQQKLPKIVQTTGVGIPDEKNDWLDILLKSRQRMTIGKTKTASRIKDDKCPQPTNDRTLSVWETARATSATPMFFSGNKLDEVKSAQTDGLVGSKSHLVPNAPPTEHRSIQSPAVLQLESKVTLYIGNKNLIHLLMTIQVLQTIPTTSQSFLSVRFLGSGGFSTVDEVVHRGTNLRLGRKTLKNRDPAAIKELWKEVNILQKLRHPHVIRFLGAYSKGDKMSILLSPIADTTLALWLDRFSVDKPANFSQVITKMFGCLASSVRYLHEQRPIVKHMDIKPQNILIVEGDGEFPHVVLCDFGISCSDDIYEGRSQPLTRQYVAPEAFGGFTRKSAADIWSLGCVFAEMASTTYSQDNSKWLELRKEFSGRTGKYYWQDAAGLQDRLTGVLDEATTITERTVVRTLKAMLRPQPTDRPDAASLTLVFTPASCCLSWPNDKATYPGPREELSSVEMLIHEDGVDCRAQLHQHGELTAKSELGLPSAKSWLEQCSHSHEACSHASPAEARNLPTRLVDINPNGEEGKCVRLVDSASLEQGTATVAYIALSHVWSQSDATLSTTNLQAMQTNISYSALSDTLKSAITAAQGLGFRYIWTDSLCVLQDSEANKQDECANMASVFRNAALTLVLDSIDNGLEDFKNMLAQSGSGFGWDTRVWALQERLLSRRFLHLGQEQMYWECNSLKASETFPRGLPLLVWEKAHSESVLSEGNQLQDKQSFRMDKLAALPGHELEPRRIRNCQWVKKQGDGIGDSMEAAQTTLQISATLQAGLDMATGFARGRTDTRNSKTVATSHGLPMNVQVQPSIDVDTNATAPSIHANARQEIGASGQMDQNGSIDRELTMDMNGGDVNANMGRKQ